MGAFSSETKVLQIRICLLPAQWFRPVKLHDDPRRVSLSAWTRQLEGLLKQHSTIWYVCSLLESFFVHVNKEKIRHLFYGAFPYAYQDSMFDITYAGFTTPFRFRLYTEKQRGRRQRPISRGGEPEQEIENFGKVQVSESFLPEGKDKTGRGYPGQGRSEGEEAFTGAERKTFVLNARSPEKRGNRP